MDENGMIQTIPTLSTIFYYKLIPFWGAPSRLDSYWHRGLSFTSKLHSTEFIGQITYLITHWEKLFDSDWLRHCDFIRNLRENSVIQGKLQISRAKSVIHS